MKKIILILIVLTAVLESCKYKEGPLFSLLSAKNRFYGTHTLTTYTVNGEDSLSSYTDSLGVKFKFLYDDVNSIDACEISGKRNNGTESKPIGWRWNLKDKNKILNVYKSMSLTNGTGPFGNDKIIEWEIIRLKCNDIRMKTNYSGKDYYIELEGDL